MKKIGIIDIDCSDISFAEYDLLILLPGVEQHSNTTNSISVSNIIEQNDIYLRSKMFKILQSFAFDSHEFGNVIKYSTIKHNFSYWWLSSVAEQSNWSESFYLNELIILYAIDLILKQYSSKDIFVLFTESTDRYILIERYFKTTSLNLKIASTKIPYRLSVRNKIRLFYPYLFGLCRALKYILFNSIYALLCNTNLPSSHIKSPSIVVFDYISPSDLNSAKHSNSYKSRYWPGFSELALEYTNSTIRCFIPSFNGDINCAIKLQSFIDKLNKKASNSDYFSILSFIDIPLLFDAIKDWLTLLYRIVLLGKFFKSKHSLKTLSHHYIYNFWLETTLSSASLHHILSYKLISKLLLHLKNSSCILACFYLFENQPWEKSLIYHWSTLYDTPIYGISHTPIRFWDLRFCSNYQYKYFWDVYKFKNNLAFLSNDSLIQFKDNSLLDSNHLLTLEALRYSYLHDHTPTRKPSSRLRKKILLVGDYLKLNTISLLRLLDSSKLAHHPHLEFHYKPHPLCSINSIKYFENIVSIESKPLEKCLSNYDLAIISEFTSASIDAYFCGTPFIICLDSSHLNFSPFYKLSGAIFVNNASQLNKVTLDIFSRKYIPSAFSSSFMDVNSRLPRWRNLFSEINAK